MIRHVALFSGGKDSLVATHYAQTHFPIDEVAYLDTNTGLPENLQYVRETANRHGWNLRVEAAPMELREFAHRYGFPSPASHSWAFAYFKERQIHRIRKDADATVFYTGVRSSESDRRMKNIGGKYQTVGGITYAAPIHDFTKADVKTYIDTHGLATNPLYDTIGRSGDCYCGAYAHRTTELGELAEYYPEHYEFIKSVESDVTFREQVPPERQLWGFGGLSAKELRNAVAANDDKQMSLCSNCDVDL